MSLRTPFANDAKTYGFEYLRALVELDGQEGVVNAGDFAVTAAAAGGLRVDVASGIALVRGDSGTLGLGITQGLYLVVNDAAIANAVTLGNADPTNPRIDQIVLHVYDTLDLGSGSDSAAIEVIAGTATAGATLDNRNGAAALPNDCIRLADVLIPAGGTATSSGNMRDRRPWARGASDFAQRTSGDITISNTTPLAEFDTTNFKRRIECSGSPLRVTFTAGNITPAASSQLDLGVLVDGVAHSTPARVQFGNGTMQFPVTTVFMLVGVAAGSHQLGMAAYRGAANVAIGASATYPASMHVEELVRQNARNNATTG